MDARASLGPRAHARYAGRSAREAAPAARHAVARHAGRKARLREQHHASHLECHLARPLPPDAAEVDGRAPRAHAARCVTFKEEEAIGQSPAGAPSRDGLQRLHHLPPHQPEGTGGRRHGRRGVRDAARRSMILVGMHAAELARRLGRRELTALDVVNAYLEVIEGREQDLGAWAALDPELARREARACDAGAVRGPLHGLPVGVKDILDTADLVTEYGTPIYAGHRPAWDAACVAAARAAGAVIVGKTVTTELATMSPAATVNPHDACRTPGGSSSGSAAAVAAGMVPFAYGTQTVGSIIRPAAYCGVVGYKPSFGTLSRTGMKMASESLDTVGVIARSVEDAALLVGGSTLRRIEIPVLDRPKLALCRTPNWDHMTPDGAAAFE